jgi:hypothetical protein
VDEAAAKLKMEITSKPLALDEVDRKVLQLEMERLSLVKAADTDRGARQRLAGLDAQLAALKEQQAELNAMWEEEREEMDKVQRLKAESDRVNIEIQVGAQGGHGMDSASQGVLGRWRLRWASSRATCCTRGRLLPGRTAHFVGPACQLSRRPVARQASDAASLHPLHPCPGCRARLRPQPRGRAQVRDAAGAAEAAEGGGAHAGAG